jgi:hypothetical protein
MNNTLHTPGPWKYEFKNYDNGESYFRIMGTPNGLENNLPHDGAFVAKITGKKERSETNARLISAAPDLLSALEFLLADYIAINGEKLTGSDVPLNKAFSAIAKAKGAA